jgi:hypothetical protein
MCMSIRKVYEIALRIIGVVFLAQGAVSGIMAPSWLIYVLTTHAPEEHMVANAVMTVVLFAAKVIIGLILIYRAPRYAKAFTPIEENSAFQPTFNAKTTISVAITLIGTYVAAMAAASLCGEIVRLVALREYDISVGIPPVGRVPIFLAQLAIGLVLALHRLALRSRKPSLQDPGLEQEKAEVGD